MVTQSACKCDEGFQPASSNDAGTLPVPTCVEIPKETGIFAVGVDPKLFLALIAGLPSFFLCCSCFLFWCGTARTQASKVRKMKADVDRFLSSYEQANKKLEPNEVEVDLCMPLGPTNFYARPSRGDETALEVTLSDLKRIDDHARNHEAIKEPDLVHSTSKLAIKGLGLILDSDSDEERAEEPDEDKKIERMRKIRSLRQTVSRISVSGPRLKPTAKSSSDDVEVVI